MNPIESPARRLRLPGKRESLLLLLLGAATVAVYANHFDNGFHFDDSHVVVDNTAVTDLANVPRFFTDPETISTLPTNRAYRPLVLVTLAVDYALAGGLEPFFFHLSTFVWFLVQGLLMVLLFVRILDRSLEHRWNYLIASLAVGWYWLHTANAETINYVTARSDSLSTLAVVAGLVIFAHAPPRGRVWALVPTLAGMLVKPTTVMFVPILFLYVWLFEEGRGLGAWLRRGPRPWAALGRAAVQIAPYAVVLGLAFGFVLSMAPDSWDLGGPSRLEYLRTQGWVVLRYFWTFFVPLGLSADTDWRVLESIADARFWAGLGFVVSSAAVIVWTSDRAVLRPIAFGLGWFFLALVPSSSVIPLAEVTNDHRMFYPFVGLVLAAAWGLALVAMRFEERLSASSAARWSLVATCALVLGLHALGVRERNEVWHSGETLWADVVEKSPSNGRAMMNYGLALMRRGELEEARRWYLRALDSGYGSHPYVRINLAIVSDRLGSEEDAARYYEEVIALAPNNPIVNYHYATWLERQGDLDGALRRVEIALRQSPSHRAANVLRRRLAVSQLPLEEALAAVEAAPTPESLIELSLRFYEAEDYEECVRLCRVALELRDGYVPAYNNICAAFNAMGRWSEAIAACEEALALDPDHQLARNNLAWARQKQAEAQSR